MRGLFRFYEQLAERFAAAGHPAIAIDYFGRTAGLGPRDEDFEWMPHVKQTTPESVALDVAARAARRSAPSAAVTVGFCFGGAQSFMSATFGHAGLAGAVGFYGSLVTAAPARGHALVAGPRADARSRCSACSAAPTRTSRPIRSRPSTPRSPVEHEIHTYPGAPHSFFDRRQEDFKDESDDAWRRILGFIEKL